MNKIIKSVISKWKTSNEITCKNNCFSAEHINTLEFPIKKEFTFVEEALWYDTLLQAILKSDDIYYFADVIDNDKSPNPFELWILYGFTRPEWFKFLSGQISLGQAKKKAIKVYIGRLVSFTKYHEIGGIWTMELTDKVTKGQLKSRRDDWEMLDDEYLTNDIEEILSR